MLPWLSSFYHEVCMQCLNHQWNSYVNVVTVKMAYVNCSQTLPVCNENCWLGLLWLVTFPHNIIISLLPLFVRLLDFLLLFAAYYWWIKCIEGLTEGFLNEHLKIIAVIFMVTGADKIFFDSDKTSVYYPVLRFQLTGYVQLILLHSSQHRNSSSSLSLSSSSFQKKLKTFCFTSLSQQTIVKINFVYCIKTSLNPILKHFSQSYFSLVFLYQTVWQYSDGDLPNWGVE